MLVTDRKNVSSVTFTEMKILKKCFCQNEGTAASKSCKDSDLK